jgi:hypothetical protein
MPKKRPTSASRVLRPKRRPDSRKDAEWCHYCGKHVPKGRLAEHKKAKHNEDESGPATRTGQAKATTDIFKKKAHLKASVTPVQRRTNHEHDDRERELEDWEVPFVKYWDAINKLTHMRGLPQFKRKIKNSVCGEGRVCPACQQSIPSGEFATHTCKAITATVPNVRKSSSLPRKQRYVKVKSGFKAKLSDSSGGQW